MKDLDHRPSGLTPALLAELDAEAARNDPEGLFPHRAFDLLIEAGAIRAPAEPGFSLREALAAILAVSERDPAAALLLSFHFSIVNGVHTGESRWPEAARDKLLEGVRTRGDLINNIIAEPELGGPTYGGRPATLLSPLAGGRHALNGRKIYATGAERLRWATLPVGFAEEPKKKAVVLLDLRKPGVSIRKTWDSLGMRSTRSDDLILEGVEIGPEEILEIQDLDAPRPLLREGATNAWAQILMPSIYHGAARAARNWYARFLQERVPAALGRPLATLEKFQEILGEIDRMLLIDEALMSKALADQEAGAPSAVLSAAVFRATVLRHARRIAETISETAGNRALQRGEPFERHFRNIVHASAHTPNLDQIVKFIGQQGLKAGA